MFSALPFSDAKFELAISVLQPLNFHLAMPNYANTTINTKNDGNCKIHFSNTTINTKNDGNSKNHFSKSLSLQGITERLFYYAYDMNNDRNGKILYSSTLADMNDNDKNGKILFTKKHINMKNDSLFKYNTC